MSVAYGSIYPTAYKMGATAVAKIYLGISMVWPAVAAPVLCYSGEWDAGGNGTSGSNALSKSSWGTTNTSRDQQLQCVAMGPGTLYVTWTGSSATSDESTYGEGDAWKNSYPPIGLGVTPVINLQSNGLSGGSGSYTASMVAGDFFVFHLSGYATWTNLKVWAEADPSYSPPVITITSQPTNQTASSGAATFSMSASVTTGSLAYQWYRQAKGAGSFAAISGQTASTLSLTGLSNSANDGDVYRCVVSRSCVASAVSNEATLSVPGSPLGSGAFYDPNSVWTSIGFAGSGTASDPYTKSSIASGAGDGMSIRVSAAGYVRFRADSLTAPYYYLASKNGSVIFGLNGTGGTPYWGTRPVPYWSSDNLPIPGGSWYAAVSAGDLITFGSDTFLGAPLASYTNLAIWYAPTATDIYS